MSEPKAERRFVELRSDDSGITGVVLRYGDKAKFGRFTERFEAGALKPGPDMIANVMHDRMKPVARSGAGLTVRDDGQAVTARIEWPETVYAREARELVTAGVLTGLSVEFHAVEDRFEGTERIISEARMTGLGIVDRPAYSESVIEGRMAEMAGAAKPAKRRRLL